MYAVSIYGKGGIGKSTISSNISYGLSEKGFNVLHVGCDPKHDSTKLLMNSIQQNTFMDYLTDSDMANPILEGSNGVSCIECGGAIPGLGCAGKGIVRMFDYLKENSSGDYDIRIHDVLGDVVCGGFSVPMRKEFADAIVLVISDEFMSIYAANNILIGIRNLNNGPCILGAVINRKTLDKGHFAEEFARAAKLPILGRVSKSDAFAQAERIGSTVLESFSESDSAYEIRNIIDIIIEAAKGSIDLALPYPLTDEAMEGIISGKCVKAEKLPDKEIIFDFDFYDHGVGMKYFGNYVTPCCTSHGGVKLLQEMSDVGIVLHGPRNCAFLMEYSNLRRSYKTRSLTDEPSLFNLYSTCMSDDLTFKGDTERIKETVEKVAEKGYGNIFILPTCAPAAMGTDLKGIADEISIEGVNVIAVPEDSLFLSSKFGCLDGVLRRMSGMLDRNLEVIPDTVNLLTYSISVLSRPENIDEISEILNAVGLRPNTVFARGVSIESIKKMPSAEYNIQVGVSMLGDKITEILTEGREHIVLRMPHGLYEVKAWISALSEMTGRHGSGDAYLRTIEKNYYDSINEMRKYTEGKTAMIYERVGSDMDWYIDTLLDMGITVKCFAHWKCNLLKDNDKETRHKEIEHIYDLPLCEVKGLMDKMGCDILVSGDPRVGRIGANWVGLNTNFTGLRGTLYWAKRARNAFRMPACDGWRDPQ
ncbi:MAG: AAA family ATPase [Methanomassiliicoccaceae archaeon]|nr:AAA family ATPase [Methanomassiliicoccaceae archaeon]